MRRKIWYGDVDKCTMCGREIQGEFVDGKLKHGSKWELMCITCFKSWGSGLGLRKGQLYKKEEDGVWYKVERASIPQV